MLGWRSLGILCGRHRHVSKVPKRGLLDDEGHLEKGVKMKKTEIFEQVVEIMREDSSTKKDIMVQIPKNIERVSQTR